jgi:hypothetical protein
MTQSRGAQEVAPEPALSRAEGPRRLSWGRLAPACGNRHATRHSRPESLR